MKNTTTKIINARLCYVCGKPIIPTSGGPVFCSKECKYKGERSYASECFGYNNKLYKKVKVITTII
jgi:predicted nucleic acid-binding Zn ribbon protein